MARRDRPRCGGDVPTDNLDPRPNWVLRNDSTDGRFSSIRSSVLFLNWLRFQLRYGWREIIAAGGGTLSATYLHVTGKRTGWEDFWAFISAHFPPGGKYRLETNDSLAL